MNLNKLDKHGLRFLYRWGKVQSYLNVRYYLVGVVINRNSVFLVIPYFNYFTSNNNYFPFYLKHDFYHLLELCTSSWLATPFEELTGGESIFRQALFTRPSPRLLFSKFCETFRTTIMWNIYVGLLFLAVK